MRQNANHIQDLIEELMETREIRQLEQETSAYINAWKELEAQRADAH